VRDGDTIEVDGTPVRLKGLHAPELGEDGGAAASAKMREIALGKETICELDGTTTYDRLVGICYVGGQDIAAELVSSGLGRDCPKFSQGRYADMEMPEAKKFALPSYCNP
jgi:endonuclease YncB( thermonuclease family)